MNLQSRLVVLLQLTSVLFFLSTAQLKESIERNVAVHQRLRGCLEGFSETISGEVIDYPRIRDDRPLALITRATTGTHAIEWKSSPVPATAEGDVSFAVHAGILTRPNASFRFSLFVNDAPAVTFSTVDTASWEAGTTDGVQLAFFGVMRDQHTDAFGYLRIQVPAAFVTPGEPVRFRVVGDSAGSRVWFMVFQDADVLTYLSEKVRNESWCELRINGGTKEYAASLAAPTTWLNKSISYSFDDSPRTPLVCTLQHDTATASWTIPAQRQANFRLFVDGETFLDLPGLPREVDENILNGNRLVTLKSRTTAGGSWELEQRSIYAPQLDPSLSALASARTRSDTLHLIVSTHQDIAWMDSPEQCIKDRDEKILTPALEIMKEDPTYRFDVEDVLFLREFLERHPDRKDDLLKVILNGQLGIGASYNQPYEELASGEMLIRQFYAGRKWLKKNLPGTDARTYWNPDVPGRVSQMPQIMKKAGVDYLFMSRFGKGLYRWLSPDSSSILAMSPGHYGDFAERVGRKGFPEMAVFAANFSRDWSGEIGNGSTNVPVVSMSDMSTPVRYGTLINTWNDLKFTSGSDIARPFHLPPLQTSTADRFFRAVASEDLQPPVLLGERPNIWLYIHGPTHHWAISAKREADVFLPAAETFSTLDAILEGSFDRYPQSELGAAWEAQIYPDHGWGGKNGEITDSTFRAKYEYARDVAKNVHARATTAIAERVRTAASKGLPFVVFNSLSWRRTAPLQFTATFPPGDYKLGFSVYDKAGRVEPCQAVAIDRYSDGSIRSATIIVVAENVPALGYSTYYIRRSPHFMVPDTASGVISELENRHYRVTLATGGVGQIFDMKLQQDLLNTEKFFGGELFTMQSVGEDAGEWPATQQPTMDGFDKMSNYDVSWKLVESGPVRQVAELRQEMNHVTVVQRLILYSTLKQLDFETDLLNWDGTKYREFRLAFPLRMETGQVAYEAPFDVIEVGRNEILGAAGERYTTEASSLRPRTIQRWISASDQAFGVTFSSSVAM